ncbi:GNAT family N-acetyltransferase [Mesorhizobium sp. VK25A]|uniref:GNAT family N-acetyltransferase n=1 Tax=Mesorhizobium vachelliae TaxID=3072309 RepID=A0ABU5ACK0_9HYPH|nr:MULTISPECIES: GNAT family N-acetyltransferase [unclassified Mesorhizobium]MDX8534399.1 GNAT family N-acetyltransferase [Mesorhizobium sp. VK25D]MDX8547041.1 GNAT family N-acetyltransferase [Mesorhizobium sp. VK25A]
MASQAMPMAAMTTGLADGEAAPQAAGAASTAYVAELHTSLETAKPLWLRFEATGVCTGHQHFAWAEGIVEGLLPQKADLAIVEVRDAGTGEPRMLVPLMRRRAFHHWVIEWLSCGVCDYAAPLLADATPWTRQSAEAAWAAVLSVLPPADRIHIVGIPKEVGGVANPLALLAPARDSIHSHYGIAMDGDAETVVKRICRPSFVKALNKDLRRLDRNGGLALVEADTPALVDSIFDELVELRLSRFRELGRFDLMAQPAVVDFYRAAAHRGLTDGSVRIFGLRAGDVTVAVQYLAAHLGTLHALLIAIDQGAVPNVSPGLCIMGELIRWGRGAGFDYFDLSVGNQSYKEHMGAVKSVLSELCYGITLKGVAASEAIKYRGQGVAFVRDNPRLFKVAQEFMQRWRRLRAGS